MNEHVSSMAEKIVSCYTIIIFSMMYLCLYFLTCEIVINIG